MPKLILVDGHIEITDRQWKALETIWDKVAEDKLIKINGVEYPRKDIIGLEVEQEPKPEYKPTPTRQINKLPAGIVLPDRLQQLFDAGENIDWYFKLKRKK